MWHERRCVVSPQMTYATPKDTSMSHSLLLLGYVSAMDKDTTLWHPQPFRANSEDSPHSAERDDS